MDEARIPSQTRSQYLSYAYKLALLIQKAPSLTNIPCAGTKARQCTAIMRTVSCLCKLCKRCSVTHSTCDRGCHELCGHMAAAGRGWGGCTGHSPGSTAWGRGDRRAAAHGCRAWDTAQSDGASRPGGTVCNTSQAQHGLQVIHKICNI